ncbi:MAG: PAS domain S-box protein [Halobacteriovoraceae bacterium]|nr:PAS domain S-box protein [Halobacteriovoraceae bacterium]
MVSKSKIISKYDSFEDEDIQVFEELFSFYLFTIDIDGEIVSANKDYKDKIKSRNILDIIEKKHHAKLKIFLKSKQGHQFYIVKINNMPNWNYIKLVKIRKKIYGYGLVVDDLVKNNELNAIALDQAKIGTWVYDIKKSILWWSEQIYRVHSIELEKNILLNEAFSFYLPEFKEKILQYFQNCIELQEEFDDEFKINTNLGQTKWIRTSGKAIVSNGEVTHINGTIQDIDQFKKIQDTLEDNNTKLSNYKLALDSNTFFFEINTEGIIVDVNQNVISKLKYKKSDIIGRDLHWVQGNFNTLHRQKMLWNKINKSEVWSGEFDLKRKYGDKIWTQATAVPILEKDKLISYYLVCFDMTKVKKVEEKLNATLKNASDLIFIMDIDGTYHEIFDNEEGDLPDEKENLIGMNIYDLYDSSFADALLEQFNNVIETGKATSFEYESPGRNGHDFFNAKISKLNEMLVVMSVRNITERVLNEQKIKNNEKQMRSFVKHLPTSVAMLDHNMNFLAMSQKWEKEFDISIEQIEGKNIFETTYLKKQYWEDIFKKAQNGQTIEKEQDQFENKLNKLEWFKWEVAPWYESEGVGGAIIVIESIEESVKLKEEIERQRLNTIQANKLASIGEMSASVAHELNNPLAVVLGYCKKINRIAQKNNDTELLKFTKKLDENSKRMSEIVKQLKGLSGNVEVDDKAIEFDLSEIIDNTVALFISNKNNENINVSIDGDKNIQFFGKKASISQLFYHLLNNSVEAIEKLKQKWIKIYIENKIDAIDIRIIDSGEGIPIETVKNIFEPFFTTKNDAQSTGLGMSLALNIVKEHNGQIKYEFFEGHTSFIISFEKKIAAKFRVA